MAIRLELIGGPLDGLVRDEPYRSPPPEIRLAAPVPLKGLRRRREAMRAVGAVPQVRYVFDGGGGDRVSVYLYKGRV